MSFMLWNDGLSIGHDAIDTDHKLMLHCMNDLHDALGRSDALSANVFRILGEFTFDHFRREENLMWRSNYPDTPHHKKEHKALLARLESHREKYLSGQESREILLKFLKRWLMEHIEIADRKLADYLTAGAPGRSPRPR
jgi:hemerythrin-like metal-binding protein